MEDGSGDKGRGCGKGGASIKPKAEDNGIGKTNSGVTTEKGGIGRRVCEFGY